MKKRVVDLQAKRQERAGVSMQEKAEEILWALEKGVVELKSRTYEISACFRGQELCPRHLFGLLIGDLRRVEERLQKIREFFPKSSD